MINNPINDLFTSHRPLISVEFFPPKEDGENQIKRVTSEITAEFTPDFVSITYGAGGSTRERTLNYAKILKDQHGFQIMPHFTCVGASIKELESVANEFKESGFRNIMTLRGDPPKGETKFVPAPDGLSYGSDLVAFLQEKSPEFCLGVAGYPEKHPEAPSLKEDIANLKLKVSKGASFVTTQLFYDNQCFFDFVEKCRQFGITQPIIAGIMPVLSLKQIKRFCAMCGSHLPNALEEKLEAAGEDETAVFKVGADWAYDQVKALVKEKVCGIHFYILNRSEAVVSIVKRLKAEGLLTF